MGRYYNIVYRNRMGEENKYNGGNLVDFGKEVVDKCCLLVVALGMSNSIKINKVKICVSNEIVEINCKEFAKKYKKYVDEIEKNIEMQIAIYRNANSNNY